MLLINLYAHAIRVNPFEDPETIRQIKHELCIRGAAARLEDGEARYGFRSLSARDALLENLRARFGRASVEAEDGPYCQFIDRRARFDCRREPIFRRRLLEEAGLS